MTLPAFQTRAAERFNGTYLDQDALKRMPHNLEAEQALLGALLFDNAAIEAVEGVLQADCFFEPFHGHLYGAVVDIARSGKLVEPLVLMERFKTWEAFTDLGGLRYLADLVDRAPPAAHARDFATVVRELWVRRELLRLSAETLRAALDNPENLEGEQLVERAEGGLFSLAEQGEREGKGVRAFADTLDSTLVAIAKAYQREGDAGGVPTGLVDLDRKLGGLHPSDLIILAGRPSMGKTALAANIAYNTARRFAERPTQGGGMLKVAGGRVLFFSLEMSAEQLDTRILAEATGISSDRLRKGEIDANDYGRLRDAAQEIRESPLFIDDTGGLSMHRLAARARRQKRRTGLDLIIVDYLQLITGSTQQQSQGRTQEVTGITMALKALAKELALPIVALSQLSRKVEEREDKRPQLADLRESGSIEQDADVVMFVYRENYYLSRCEPKANNQVAYAEWMSEMERTKRLADVIIGKQRHGPIGTVKLSFDEDTTKFGNLAADEYPTHWSDR